MTRITVRATINHDGGLTTTTTQTPQGWDVEVSWVKGGGA